MKELTEKQKKILVYVDEYSKEQGYPPTFREVGEYFDITPRGAQEHLKAIEKKGYVRCHQNLSRAIEILPLGKRAHPMVPRGTIRIPLLGNIAAGAPLVAEENIEEYINVPHSMSRHSSDALFALRVTGDSMRDAGIVDGDTAIIKRQQTANNGDIVVALLEDEATLKYFYRDSRFKFRLVPANPAYKPIVTRKLFILGKLVGIYRSMD